MTESNVSADGKAAEYQEPQVLFFDDETCNKDNVNLVGGKNASIGELMDAGVTVPSGFALTTSFYEAFLAQSDLVEYVDERLLEVTDTDRGTVEPVSDEIRAAIQEEPFPEPLGATLESAWNALQEKTQVEDLRVAVRSSATAEDLPDASFAGQQDTYLNVRQIDTVKQRVRECMASLFTPRAISYREQQGFDHDEVLISVGVQRLVDARTSGVIFTVNPANGDRSKVRIEANWGLGESVVSGSVNPDSFLVDKPVYKIVDRNISSKNVMTVSTDQGIEEIEVESDKQDVPSLTADEIIELTDIAKEIEQHYGDPQDIEWVIEEQDDANQIYVVQSRPETTWQKHTEDTTGESKGSGDTSPADQILDSF